MTPAERISELQKLSETAAGHTADEKLKISEQLAASIRTEKDPLIRVEIIRALGQYPGPAADAILKAALAIPIPMSVWRRARPGAVGATPRRWRC